MDPFVLLGIAVLVLAGMAALFFAKMLSAQGLAKQARLDLNEVSTKNAEEGKKAAAAEATLAETRKRMEELETEARTARVERDIAVGRATEAEKFTALANQSMIEMQKRMDDWEEVKKQSQEAANAAMLVTATQLSSKLLEDHQRATDAAKKEGEQKVEQAKEEFAKRVSDIANSVATLNTLVAENRATVDTVVRAISTPAAAGQSAEIGLENTLKAFGLERGRDFLMQHSITDADARRLRPDALVFLPSESVLVVDSKASKFLLEMAAAEGGEGEEAAYASFASTMNSHLRALAGKDYRNAIVETYRRTGRQGEIRRVISVMYLPQDSALERLKRADAEFARKASDNQIIPVGPAALACMIGFARVEIDTGRQIENQEKIVVAAQRLLDGITLALDKAEDVGKSIKGAAEHFADFAKSVNTRLLPRARAFPQLGVRPEKKPLPGNLPAVQVIGLETHTTIEGEAADDSTPALAPPKP
jgi:DNA recombination protein RmuC